MRSRILLMCFVLTCFWQSLSNKLIAQAAPAPASLIQPHVEFRAMICQWIKCRGTTNWLLIKATPEDMPAACAYACPRGYAVDAEEPDPEICAIADPSPTGQLYAAPSAPSMQPMASGLWVIRVLVCYCDGSDSRSVDIARGNYCEALAVAKSVYCKLRDPCKASCMKICILQKPVSVCAPQPIRVCR